MITLHNLSFRYPEGAPVLEHIDLEIQEGELALVTGPSGSGKSTLLRCLNGLVPHFTGGVIGGRISVAGHDPIAEGPRVLCQHVGFVFQDPEAQFVVDRVEDEIAFALENLAMPQLEMRDRVEEVLALLGLLPLRDRSLDTLSGGERQRVAIAAALALRPRILVLDEPTSQLDPIAAEELLRALIRLNGDRGLTIVLAEHRLERILPHATQLIHLPGRARPALCGAPREVLAEMELVPPLVALAKALHWRPLPLTVEEAKPHVARFTVKRSAPAADEPPRVTARAASATGQSASPWLQIEDVHFAYDGRQVLRGVSLRIWPGELLALMGDNGSGKTTLLRCLVGLLEPERGRITIAGESIHGRTTAELCQRIGYLPQNPDDLLFADAVRAEIEVTLYNLGLEREPPIPLETLLERLGLAAVADRYPRDLSVGQRQRVALGAVTVTRPRLLLLDEPTRGMDYAAKRELVRLLRSWQEEGTAVLLVTHDVELVAEAADRVAILANGRIEREGRPAEVLHGASSEGDEIQALRIPQIGRLFPDEGWLTVKEALEGLQGAESASPLKGVTNDVGVVERTGQSQSPDGLRPGV
ncbi:MAG: energy-coupling factor ABC transporter ATP-binding protein [Chloroflexi bacterium]|nr:energy-coupling factor ABC transporter ATP-binding protein [Chloroflexota bacterium]